MINFDNQLLLKKYIMTREKIVEAVNDLPSEFDLDELIERLIFVEKVERGLRQLEEGKTVAHETVREKVKQWQK